MKKLLIIDDDRKLTDLLTEYLTQDGFEVQAVHNGTEGISCAAETDYDLIILDVMLPGDNGFEVLRQIRTRIETPIIMLTARSDDVDRIIGLEMGADDYLAKPFNTRELVARIRTVLRRIRPDRDDPVDLASAKKLTVGDVDMDMGTRSVICSGKSVNLTSVEFKLLEQLLRSAGELVSREDLTQKVLGRRLSPFDRSIDGYVSKLRKKLGHKVTGSERIKAIRSVGYLYALTDDKGNPENLERQDA